jgi:hypothetical protein
MRLFGLYLRSRGVPVALATAIVGALGMWAIDQVDIRLVALVIALGVAAGSGGLAGADVHLDRTAAFPWPPWRAAHLLAIVAVVAGLVICVQQGTIELIVRDSAGLTGLAALGTAVFGRQLGWGVAVAWTMVAVIFPVPDEIITWMLAPAGTTAATVTAAGLALGGAAAYSLFGPRP